jgi:vacuolar-type H+-ATPase subunit I/STV1
LNDYIKELGIDSTTATPSDAEVKDTGDFVQVSNTEETIEDTTSDTEPNVSDELKKQIEGLEKRISDKDNYINELREASKANEAEVGETEEVDTSVDFWDDPEATIKELKETMRIQNMQTQEVAYASTVPDYWKTVNPEALKSAVATDTEFANTFNSSNAPYKVAYEYLVKQTETAKASEQSLREQIKAELLKEMGMDKPKKGAVPNMGNMGGASGGKRTESSDDGFSSVFGKSRY